MIYTVTFNPSLDYIVEVDEFKEGQVNRNAKEYILPGGKGVNVSIVLNNLGVESTVLGFIAGFTGDEIENRLIKDHKLTCDFIKLEEGYSRINFKMKSKEETEVNGIGPSINENHFRKLINQLKKLQQGDILILSGSVLKSLKDTVYAEIMNELSDKDINIVIDSTGRLLMNTLDYKPFLIKPNNHELEEMFHVKLFEKNDIIHYAKELQQMGARNVLVSMAKDGAILVCEDGNVYESEAPKGKVQNSVGAGDSMVAGFVAGYSKTKDYQYALKLGICTGSASAFSKNLATKEEVKELMKKQYNIDFI